MRGIRALVLAATSVVFALGIIYESRAMLPSQPSSSVSSCTRQASPSLSCDANGAAADQSLSLLPGSVCARGPPGEASADPVELAGLRIEVGIRCG